MSSDSRSPFATASRSVITPKTWIAVPIGLIFGLIVGIIYAHGTVRDYMQEQRDAFREIRDELRAIRSEQARAWRIDSMERWAGRTRWENREKAIIIPEPREFWQN